jgi:hypothetical protein
LRRAGAEYRELAGRLRELARVCLFPGPRRSLVQLAISFDVRAAHFRLRGGARPNGKAAAKLPKRYKRAVFGHKEQELSVRDNRFDTAANHSRTHSI